MSDEARTSSRMRGWWPVAAALALVAVVVLRVPLGTVLGLGLLLLCPLLMMGMHGASDAHGGGSRSSHDEHDS